MSGNPSNRRRTSLSGRRNDRRGNEEGLSLWIDIHNLQTDTTLASNRGLLISNLLLKIATLPLAYYNAYPQDEKFGSGELVKGGTSGGIAGENVCRFDYLCLLTFLLQSRSLLTMFMILHGKILSLTFICLHLGIRDPKIPPVNHQESNIAPLPLIVNLIESLWDLPVAK